MSAEAEIAAMLDSWTAAVRARDLEGATQGRSNNILMFDVPEPLQSKGMAAYRDTWRLYFGNEGAARFGLEETNIVAGADVAWVSAVLRCTMADYPEGRLTMGLRRIAGQWVVEHEHHSFPLPLNP